MEKKEYTPKEAALGVLEKVKQIAKEHLAKHQKAREEVLEKAAPQNQSAARISGVSIPQDKAPKGEEKLIPNQKELKLKKFMEQKGKKRLEKAEGETKHDRCARKVKEKSPDVKDPHAVCVAAGVRPEKWKK